MSRRSLLALAAALIAAVDFAIAWVSPSFVVFPVVGGIAAVGGLGALALALIPPRSGWSLTRRSAAVGWAAIWLAALVLAFPITFAYRAAPPEIGEDTGDSTRLAVAWTSALGPLVLLAAAGLPARLERRDNRGD